MSMIENLVNQIATNGLNGVGNHAGFDLQDETFSKLLEKQMNQTQNISMGDYGKMGIPAGFIIEALDGTEFANQVQEQIETNSENKLSKAEYINQPVEFKELDTGDYFSTLLKSNSPDNSDFMNFAKKQATAFYNRNAKELVIDANEFVMDVLKN